MIVTDLKIVAFELHLSLQATVVVGLGDRGEVVMAAVSPIAVNPITWSVNRGRGTIANLGSADEDSQPLAGV